MHKKKVLFVLEFILISLTFVSNVHAFTIKDFINWMVNLILPPSASVVTGGSPLPTTTTNIQTTFKSIEIVFEPYGYPAAKQNYPNRTVGDDDVWGYISVFDAWDAQYVGGNWTWDFGSSITGTFTIKWFAKITGDYLPDYCVNVSYGIYVSNDGSNWIAVREGRLYHEEGSTWTPPVTMVYREAVRGTYRYVRASLFSSRSCMVSDAQLWVDDVGICSDWDQTCSKDEDCCPSMVCCEHSTWAKNHTCHYHCCPRGDVDCEEGYVCDVVRGKCVSKQPPTTTTTTTTTTSTLPPTTTPNCSGYTDCSSCANDTNCKWCVDDGKCYQLGTGGCSKWIYIPKNCPTTTTTIQPTDDPCDNSDTWQKYDVYCCEGNCTKDESKIRGFCLDKSIYEQNKDKLELVKEGAIENCVKCKNDACCHEIIGLCYDFAASFSTGCQYPGAVTSACGDAGGNICNVLPNIQRCTLKESSSKVGPIYCANCVTTTSTTTPKTSTTKPPTTSTLPPTTTSTLPPTTTSTTSTTTIISTTTLPTGIQCQECYARSKCECNLTTPCNNGLWVLQNKEANPLDSMVTLNLPPTTIQFEPKASGKILITTICFKDSGSETSQYTLEVKEPFLECNEDCKVLEPCECRVRGCRNGSLNAVIGNVVLKWKERITSTDFTSSFISDKPGVVSVSVQCLDPMVYAEKEVALGGEIRPTRIFSASNFTSISQDGSYKIKLDYSNTLEEDVIIVFTLSKEGRATNKRQIVEPGDGTVSQFINCEELAPGTYSVSWKAFKSSDNRNPIVWSRIEEMVSIRC